MQQWMLFVVVATAILLSVIFRRQPGQGQQGLASKLFEAFSEPPPAAAPRRVPPPLPLAFRIAVPPPQPPQPAKTRTVSAPPPAPVISKPKRKVDVEKATPQSGPPRQLLEMLSDRRMLVGAFMLNEVLGPPLSRRRRPGS